jgi:hypothetical protein
LQAQLAASADEQHRLTAGLAASLEQSLECVEQLKADRKHSGDRQQGEGSKVHVGAHMPGLEARRGRQDEMDTSHREKEEGEEEEEEDEAFRVAKGGLAAAERRLRGLEGAWLRRRAHAEAGTAAAAGTGKAAPSAAAEKPLSSCESESPGGTSTTSTTASDSLQGSQD